MIWSLIKTAATWKRTELCTRREKECENAQQEVRTPRLEDIILNKVSWIWEAKLGHQVHSARLKTNRAIARVRSTTIYSQQITNMPLKTKRVQEVNIITLLITSTRRCSLRKWSRCQAQPRKDRNARPVPGTNPTHQAQRGLELASTSTGIIFNQIWTSLSTTQLALLLACSAAKDQQQSPKEHPQPKMAPLDQARRLTRPSGMAQHPKAYSWAVRYKTTISNFDFDKGL